MKTYIILSLITIMLFAINAFAQPAKKIRRPIQQSNVSSSTDFDKFVGVWEFTPDYSLSKEYFKVTKEQPQKFKFIEGFEYQGNITWAETILNRVDAIYLRPLNGKLVGQFSSPNFRATHGYDFTYRIALSIGANGKLLYTISGDLSEKHYATRVNGGDDASEVVTSRSEVTIKSNNPGKVLANKGWQPFWVKFSNAVYTKDLKTLVRLSCSNFFYYDGTAEDWLKLKMKSSEWSSIKKAVMSGTRPLEEDERNEIERITIKYEDLVFKFENGRRWCFSQPAMGD